jgi:hypothetical protein
VLQPVNLYRNELGDVVDWVRERIKAAPGPVTVHVLGNGEILTKLARTDRIPVVASTYVGTYSRTARFAFLLSDLAALKEARFAVKALVGPAVPRREAA